EAAGGANAALRREGAAEHGAAIGESLAAETALNEVGDRKHAVQFAFLIHHERTIDPGIRAQDHLIPVTGNLLQFPQHRRHHLVAHLFRHRDAVGLHLSIGVIGAEADKDAALPADQDELDFATGIIAADFDAVSGGDPPRRDA